MNSTHVFNAIEHIAVHSSKNEKVELLKSYLEDPNFLMVVQYAYNPMMIFGVGKKTLAEINPASDVPTRQFTLDTWAMLDDLASGKLSGDAAVAAITKEIRELDGESEQLLRRILLGDLRADFAASSINKARPKTILEIPYMRCCLPHASNIDKFDWAAGCISQEKADGSFANVTVRDDGVVSVSTRDGFVYPLGCFDNLELVLSQSLKRSTQTHGELVICDSDGFALPREEGNGILNSLMNGGSIPPERQVYFYAWDQIPLDAAQPKGKYQVPYRDRLRHLIAQMPMLPSPLQLIETKVVRSKEEALAHFREKLRHGREGTVVKAHDAIWKDGTSKDQVKFKLEFVVDLEVVGFEEGDGKFKGSLGSLICQSACGNLVVNVGGRGDAMRAEAWANQESWLNTVIAVKANTILKPSESSDKYSLFLPIFVERRNADKSIADNLEQIQEQYRAAVEYA